MLNLVDIVSEFCIVTMFITADLNAMCYAWCVQGWMIYLLLSHSKL